MRGDPIEEVPLSMLVQHGHETQIVAPLLLALLEDRQHVALHPRTEVDRVSESDEHPSSLVELRQAVLEDGLDELLLRSEVVLDGRVVGVPGLDPDLSEGGAVEPPGGKQALCGEHDLMLCRKCQTRHQPMKARWTPESQSS